MLNIIAIMGRLVRDPELRQTTTGKNVASFRVAVDRGSKDANGQNQADFFDKELTFSKDGICVRERKTCK